MKCKKCKKNIFPEWNFCGHCGERLKPKKEIIKKLKNDVECGK